MSDYLLQTSASPKYGYSKMWERWGGNGSQARTRDNLLIRGDALHALKGLTQLPEFAREYAGKVKLAYLDPPFNTQQAFEQNDDALEHSVCLGMMRERLAQIRDLCLLPDGSVWVHCDDSEQAYLKAPNG